MRFPDARLLVFAKAPHPGEVKSRLIPRLGARGAAELHAWLVRRTLQTAARADLCPVELWCAPTTDDPFFMACAETFPLTLHRQHGADLGARMPHALAEALTRARAAILIGSDCPALTAETLARAIAPLAAEQVDAVLTPAGDGGYVLIGLRRAETRLFDDIAWGEATVMAQTRERLQACGLTWHETPPLPDLDTPADLDREIAAGRVQTWPSSST